MPTPPKKPNVEKKTKIFLAPTVPKNVTFVKFGVKKQIWQPWGAEAACTLSFAGVSVCDDNGSSAPEVKIPPCQHTWFWMAWSVEFCMR